VKGGGIESEGQCSEGRRAAELRPAVKGNGAKGEWRRNQEQE
jgi:hypothetical protein